MTDDTMLAAVHYDAKQAFFASGATSTYEFRLQQLKILKAAIQSREQEIIEALHADFGKPAFEAYMTEIGFMYDEIHFAIRNLKRWMRPRRRPGRLAMFPTRLEVRSVPKGVVLIVGPWNYPFQLALSPLVGAIAAGNCAVLKPSHVTARVSAVLAELVKASFDPAYISVVEGSGSVVVPAIMERWRFDHVFFTGSPAVGRQIGMAAAERHTPFTLELGGKSPAVVDASADIVLAARRIAWAKCLNAGQTCIAPDYVLVHESRKAEFVAEFKKAIHEYLGENPLASADLASIINERRFQIVRSYLDGASILSGGRSDAAARRIEPTLIEAADADAPVLHEEIFGPVLPLLGWQRPEQALALIERNPFPLALYAFAQDKKAAEYFFTNVRFGGGCLNNAIIHVADPRVPFGGVGTSGVGSYHGRRSFETFSHEKTLAISRRGRAMDLVTAPYTEGKLKLIRKFMR